MLPKLKVAPLPSREKSHPYPNQQEAEAEAGRAEERTSRRLSKTFKTVGRIVRLDIRIRRLRIYSYKITRRIFRTNRA